MSYKVYIYALMLFASVFGVSALNFDEFFKKNRYFESRVFTLLLIMGLAYLSANFIIGFIE